MDHKKYLEVAAKLNEKKVSLIAVSKTKPVEDIQAMYELGQRHFGENKVQELTDKYEQLPKDIHWHAIGHLQTNKVKYIASFVHLIHAVDSLKLLKEISKRAKQSDRVVDCLLQLHIAEEDTKFGLDETELHQLLESDSYAAFQNIRIRGLMGMATFTYNKDQVKREFAGLKKLFDQTKAKYFADEDSFDTLSMGMSGDFELAIEEGSNMVRIGSLLFGSRNYSA